MANTHPDPCPHPKWSRSLLSGYDVVRGECEQIVGRVALFPCAVLSADEARALLDGENGHTGREARARLEQAVRT